MSRMGPLDEVNPRPVAHSNEFGTVSGKGVSAPLSPREPGAITGTEGAGSPGNESLADLVHRLRTPLNAALLWVRLVRQGGLDPHSVQRALETIEQNLRDQNRLLGELLGEAESGDTLGEPHPGAR